MLEMGGFYGHLGARKNNFTGKQLVVALIEQM